MTCHLSSVLVRSLCLGMVLLANHATASVIYRMVAAKCTDSNRPFAYYPDDQGNLIEGAGPKLCANHVTVEVKMRDGYIPGTDFSYVGPSSEEITPVESFRYDDGARSMAVTIPPHNAGVALFGRMPEQVERAPFLINFEPWGFHTNPDGKTWNFGLEGGVMPDGQCNLGSTERPDGCITGGIGYEAVGTYKGWQRIPEPATLALVTLALGVMGGLRQGEWKCLSVGRLIE